MSNCSETFGRLLKGAINSIAAYEGKRSQTLLLCPRGREDEDEGGAG